MYVQKRKRVSVDCSVDVALTATNNRVQQSQQKASDIDYIVGQYIRKGEVPPVPGNAKDFFRDVSKVGDFGAAMSRVLEGQALFAGLDANIRDSFHNNVSEFLEYASDPVNEAKVMEFAFGVKPPHETPKRLEGKEAPPPPADVPDEAPKAPAADRVEAPKETS